MNGRYSTGIFYPEGGGIRKYIFMFVIVEIRAYYYIYFLLVIL